ncbi:porin family protein [candidate division TA06 bacterium]|uniref:Porin family protein n=1 Tax=candidate division TA06 bacterium TaxID=2250710 RepID=A0A933IAV7_UNCT6|nr:porin family protein [candidate division TA06 bacterium]
MKKLAAVLLLVMVVAGMAMAEGFEKGKTLIGPTIGWGWGMGFGAAGEYGVTDKIGVGGEFAYSSFTEKYDVWDYWYEWKYTLIGVLGAGAYHFTPGKKFDPYVKLGLGFFNWDAEYKDQYGTTSSSLYLAGYSSGVGYAGQLGARYFFSPTMAGRAALGFPFVFSAGLDFKF